MTRITLTNDFHRTRATVVPDDGIISATTARRVKRSLCGMSDCVCGGMLGQRGQQPQPLMIEPLHDGSYRVELA